jgi:putative restriction endonuclease
MPLPSYLSAFAQLQRAPRLGSPRTRDKEPHKPLLLLAVADLIGSGYYSSNNIYLSPELSELFDTYWQCALPLTIVGNIRTPFNKLTSEGFWHASESLQPLVTKKSMRLDDELFLLLQEREAREALKAVLIDTYFDAETSAALRAQTRTSEASLLYAQRQLEALAIKETPSEPVRSQAFRLTVIRAYDYRCAICGVRIFNDEGRTVVEAAHIVPWSRTHDDSPQNGLALCRLCHWTFDAGMLTVSERYTVLTSSRLSRDRNHAGLLTVVAKREILRPVITELWPSPDKLKFHRENIFFS